MTDFKSMKITLAINHEICMKIPVDRELFLENKQGFLMYGYSFGNAAIDATINEIKISKLALKDSEMEKEFLKSSEIYF